jgi:DNA polymerase III sliding clamp (beta) subunit (PCNA family)
MELGITNPAKLEQFVHIFQHLKVFTEFINVQFLEEKLYIQGMDSSHVSIFILSMPASWFDLYRLTKGSGRGGGVSLGVNTQILAKILSAREKTQSLQWRYLETNEETMFIYFQAAAATTTTATEGGGISPSPPPLGAPGQFDRHFEMPLVEVETDMLEIPAIEYAAEFSLMSAKFAAVISQLKLFGDSMDIECTEEHIQITAHNPGTGKMCVDIKIDEVSAYAIDEGETLNLSYALSYLNNFCIFHKLAKEVHVSLSDTFPLQLAYDLSEGASMIFYLAPKISDKD